MKKETKELTNKILKIFKDNPTKGLNYKQLAKQLGLDKTTSKTKVISILSQLAQEGKLKKVQKGVYKSKFVKQRIIGVVDMSKKGAAVVFSEEFNDDIIIHTSNLKHALHNDRVEVSVYAKSKKKQLQGEVIQILERSERPFVGILSKSDNIAFVIVNNKQMPVDIFIPFKKLKSAKSGDKVICKVVDWPEHVKSPIGEIVEVLGKSGDHNVEMHAILAEFGLPYRFPKEVEEFAKNINTKISKEEINKRRDFRDTLTITIDPFDAKDFDDAISIKAIENGNYQIGIHIADVSHYVQPGSIIDKEAERRATSVYLVDRVVPMLPEVLSNNVCSLNAHTDKLCFSVVVDINKDAKITKTWIGKTIINSNKRFDYDTVQATIDSGTGEYNNEILTLNNMAQKLRAERFNEGAISFNRGELRFKIDENGKPIEAIYKKSNKANQLVEEFMLIANKEVAKKIGYQIDEKEPKTFIYRVHDAPDYEKLKQFKDFITKFGYEFSLENNKQIAKSFNELFAKLENKPESDVIANFAIRSMARAIYTIDNIGHYGLGFEYYTHFTSPIRRYPDLLVHRLLFSYLNNQKSANKKDYAEKCKHCSTMEQLAMNAERTSIKYKAVEFMSDKVGQFYDGYISGLTEWGIYVEIIPFKIEGMILIRDIENDFFFFDEKQYTLIGHYSGNKYQIGDKIKVQVSKVNQSKKLIDFVMVDTSLNEEQNS